MISRRNNDKTLNFRYYQTNPNGLCGAIALYQLRLRDKKEGYVEDRCFSPRALNLNDVQTRDDFMNFLEEIESLAEISDHKCKTSVTAMKEWLINGHCAGDKNPPSLEKELWWDSPWYPNFAKICSFTMFHDVDNKDLRLDSKQYLSAFVSSESQSMAIFNYDQVRRIVQRPNYFQYESGHFFLMETPKASLECHRLDEALQNLSELIVNCFTLDPSLSTPIHTVTSSIHTLPNSDPSHPNAYPCSLIEKQNLGTLLSTDNKVATIMESESNLDAVGPVKSHRSQQHKRQPNKAVFHDDLEVSDTDIATGETTKATRRVRCQNTNKISSNATARIKTNISKSK